MLQKIKDALRNFMNGRHGADQLSFVLLSVGVVFSLLFSITGFVLFYVIGIAAYIYGIFRMFSRNNARRDMENQKFLNVSGNFKTNVKQFFVRTKNMRKYKYFRCPQCKSRLRLPRKVGEVTVTCSKCRNQFKQKA